MQISYAVSLIAVILHGMLLSTAMPRSVTDGAGADRKCMLVCLLMFQRRHICSRLCSVYVCDVHFVYIVVCNYLLVIE